MTLALLDRSAPRSDQADLLAHRLDAMRDGRALSFSSVLSLPIALDQMVPRLAATVDGSPKTKGHAGAAGVLTCIHLASHRREGVTP